MNRSIKLAAAAVWGSLLCAQVTPPAGGGSGTVTSITLAGTGNQITATGTCTGTTTITCTLSIPSAFVLPGTIDGLTITTTTGTLTVASGKTLTASKTLTFDGTDGVTLTFPATSATIARTDADNAFTAAQTITRAGIGAVSTDGIICANSTAAAAGAQQWSCRIRLTGQGWKTTATAASQSVDWIAEVQPVQGTTHPTSLLSFSASVAGGAYAPYLTIQGDGINAGAANFTTGTTVTAAGLISGNAGGALQFSAGGWTALTGLNSTTGGLDLGQGHGIYWASGNTNQAASGDTSLCREGSGLIQFSAGTCNTTTAANYRDAKGRHLLAAGTAPTVTAGFGTSPTIAGADESILVTVGSGGIATTGTVTFGTAYGNAPNCIASDNSSLVQTRATATTTTVALSSGATPWTAGDTISILCRGYL